MCAEGARSLDKFLYQDNTIFQSIEPDNLKNDVLYNYTTSIKKLAYTDGMVCYYGFTLEMCIYSLVNGLCMANHHTLFYTATNATTAMFTLSQPK